MKPIKQFKIGSSYFFNEYPDYVSKDIDELCIMNTFPNIKTNVLNMKIKGKDVFFYRNMDKGRFIKEVEDTKVYMKLGKFLIPEFAEYINFTIDDLKQLEGLFNNLDEKHKYEKVIFDSYIENGDFTLTDEQRLAAYNEYKREREENMPAD